MSTIALDAGMSPPLLSAGEAFRRRMARANRFLVVAVGFCIPLQTSPAEVLMGLFVLTWVLSGGFAAKCAIAGKNRIAVVSLVLFVALCIGMFFSCVSWAEARKFLFKYRELVYIPIFITAFYDEKLRKRGVRAFIAGTVLLLGLSYLEFLSGGRIDIGLESTVNQGAEANAGYVIFKDRINHNLLMSFLVYWLAHQYRDRPEWRRTCGVMIVLTVVNIFFLVQGRTGYLVLGALTTLFMYQHYRLRGIAYACLLLGAAGFMMYPFSSVVRARFHSTITQLKNHFGPEKKHSPDPRLEFYENSLSLIRAHPLLGTGTGSFGKIYGDLIAGKEIAHTVDPHNEYLLMAAQIGLLGLALFLFLFHSHWTLSAGLPLAESRIAQGVVVSMATGCLFNSLLLSFTGGLFYGYLTGLCFSTLHEEAGCGKNSEDTHAEPGSSVASSPRLQDAAA